MTQNETNRAPQGIAILTILLTCLAISPTLTAQEIAELRLGSGGIEFAPTGETGTVLLTVSGPDGYYYRAELGADQGSFLSLYDEAGDALPDGVYTYELTVGPAETVRREAFDETQGLPNLSAKLDAPSPDSQSGFFAIQGGALVDSSLEEPDGAAGSEPQGNRLAEKQVISGDLTVYNSICVGFDCATSETFGADTIRLKENNLRIHFDDTSTANSFPRTDWRIEANSNLNGGGNYFRIIDVSANRNIMTLEASAPNHSLYVDNGGRVGIGTQNPVLEAHVKNGDTPGLRLEQDTSSGFAAQTWDIAGNETSLFIRDATNGSTLPFRIRPGASSNALVIDTDDDVGIGVLSPSASLHVRRTSGNVTLDLETTDSATSQFNMVNGAGEWQMIHGAGGAYNLNRVGVAGNQFVFSPNGSLIIQGTLTTGGPQCGGGCDRVFEPGYELPSIDEHAALMWERKHLPAVGPTKPGAPFNVSEKTGGILNELEKAHIYIEQLHRTVQDLRTELEARTESLSAFEERLAKLETAPAGSK